MLIGICGASGYIGWALYQFLRFKNELVLGTYYNHWQVGLVKFDLTRDDPAIFDKCGFVVITSAYAKIDFCEANPFEAHALNVWHTKRLLEYLDAKGIKSLFLSSDMATNKEKNYGKYKAQVEQFITKNLKHSSFIRPSKINDENMGELCQEIYQKIQGC